jgi:hypothetical protein
MRRTAFCTRPAPQDSEVIAGGEALPRFCTLCTGDHGHALSPFFGGADAKQPGETASRLLRIVPAGAAVSRHLPDGNLHLLQIGRLLRPTHADTVAAGRVFRPCVAYQKTGINLVWTSLFTSSMTTRPCAIPCACCWNLLAMRFATLTRRDPSLRTRIWTGAAWSWISACRA